MFTIEHGKGGGSMLDKKLQNFLTFAKSLLSLLALGQSGQIERL